MKYSVNEGISIMPSLIFTKTYINYDMKRHRALFCDRVMSERWEKYERKDEQGKDHKNCLNIGYDSSAHFYYWKNKRKMLC